MPAKVQWSFFRRLASQAKYNLDELKPPVEQNKIVGPNLQQWIYNKMGFNQYGLMRDDMRYETPIVKEALKRLPEHVQDERTFRIVRAGYLCLKKDVLPKEQWMTLDKDVLYLTPIIEEVKKEIAEKEQWENN
ncbi:cytochrome b-c1 complex subunit 7-like [Phymastichus coffea]|uniref:cytochrome b-c1 complex subunit 7-like n=1 Tax=Phymastichus coffea TaxID=108790 RepID=UPI00273C616A|nr:cytochrome b-c1 complex subunit 7-like [Phymastichus coffea]